METSTTLLQSTIPGRILSKKKLQELESKVSMYTPEVQPVHREIVLLFFNPILISIHHEHLFLLVNIIDSVIARLKEVWTGLSDVIAKLNEPDEDSDLKKLQTDLEIIKPNDPKLIEPFAEHLKELKRSFRVLGISRLRDVVIKTLIERDLKDDEEVKKFWKGMHNSETEQNFENKKKQDSRPHI